MAVSLFSDNVIKVSVILGKTKPACTTPYPNALKFFALLKEALMGGSSDNMMCKIGGFGFFLKDKEHNQDEKKTRKLKSIFTSTPQYLSFN
ncbi:MAG: hypothetical protein WC367_05585 [Methanoregula sp.]|jgi:hypothetical protein